jgi:TonB family protein
MYKLTEDEARGLDAIYKGIGILALVIGAAWTLAQYFLHRAQERETAAVESRKPFLEKRLQVYSDLVLTAGTIASSDDPVEIKKAKKQLATLSSGLLIVFDEPEVRNATEDFRECVNDPVQCQGLTVKERAEILAASCRRSVGEGWGLLPTRKVGAPPASRVATLPLNMPVDILDKPRPKYTAEARNLGIEGDVVVDVVFLADDTVQVNRVVSGLGHGLDEAAVRAAQQIKFKPAIRDGQPVDFPARVRIEFRLVY